VFLWEVSWYLDPVFLPAASGLLGVIVGGLITAGSSYILDKRRERREREKEERQAATELKCAARMLSANLQLFRSDVESVLKEKNWSSWTGSDYSPRAWLQYQTVLAPKLTKSAWDALNLALLSINGFIALRQKWREVGDHQISDSSAATIEGLMKCMDIAQQEIDAFADHNI
jgi:hypothetical protein